MKAELLSRPLRITNPQAAAIFTNSRMRRLLMQYAGEARSVSAVSQRMNMDLKQVHYCTRRLLNLKLLKVAQVLPRAGRPMKLYRTVADSFLVPDELMDVPSTQGLANELRSLLADGGDRGALLLTLGPAGEPRVQLEGTGDSRNPNFELWRILRLNRSDMLGLRADLEAVLRKYQQGSNRKGGKVFLVHCAAAMRTDDRGSVDNPAG